MLPVWEDPNRVNEPFRLTWPRSRATFRPESRAPVSRET